MIAKLLVPFFITFIFFFIIPEKVSGQTTGILINEVMANPVGSDSQFEWVELYNYSKDDINLSGWYLDGELIPVGYVPAGGFVIIVRDLESYPDLVNKIRLNFSLSNSADEVILKDNLGNVVDLFTYNSSSEGKSNERRGVLCEGYDLHELGDSIEEINSNFLDECFIEVIEEEPLPISYPDSGNSSVPLTLQISEIYPNVNSGEEEWIELYNYGSELVKLSNFYFTDNKQCNEVVTINKLNGEIEPDEYFVVYKDVSKVSLNDTGDNVFLCDVESKQIDSFEYLTSAKGKSISKEFLVDKYSDQNIANTIPTPGLLNLFPQPEEIKYLKISAVKSLPIGSEAYVEGYVSSVYESLFANTFFIQDETGGLRVYSSDFLSLKIGQKIRIHGNTSMISNDKKINANEIQLLSEYRSFNPKIISSGADLEKLTGSLVYVEGIIVNNFSTSFDLQTSVGIIRVSVLSVTGIELSEKSKGDYIKASGILTRDKDKYKILPFEAGQIQITHLEKVAAKKSSTKSVKKTYDVEDQTITGTVSTNMKLPVLEKYLLSEDEQISFDFSGISMASGSLLALYLIIIRNDLKSWLSLVRSKKESISIFPD